MFRRHRLIPLILLSILFCPGVAGAGQNKAADAGFATEKEMPMKEKKDQPLEKKIDQPVVQGSKFSKQPDTLQLHKSARKIQETGGTGHKKKNNLFESNSESPKPSSNSLIQSVMKPSQEKVGSGSSIIKGPFPAPPRPESSHKKSSKHDSNQLMENNKAPQKKDEYK